MDTEIPQNNTEKRRVYFYLWYFHSPSMISKIFPYAKFSRVIRIGYRGKPSRFEPALDFAERHNSFVVWVVNHGEATWDSEPTYCIVSVSESNNAVIELLVFFIYSSGITKYQTNLEKHPRECHDLDKQTWLDPQMQARCKEGPEFTPNGASVSVF